MDITFEQQKAIGEICRAFSRKLEKGAAPGPFLIELIRMFPEPSPLQRDIMAEIRRAFKRAEETGNPRSLLEKILTLLCAWGDTIDENDLLDQLKGIAAPGVAPRNA
jgi:hypothetical protein